MKLGDPKRRRWAVVLTSAALFIVSLTQIAFVVDSPVMEGRPDLYSEVAWDLFFFGWLSAIFDLRYVAWFANPLILATWHLYLRNAQVPSLVSAVLGLALALSFLLVETIPHFPRDGFFGSIYSYGIGYWLWIASAAILVVGMSTEIALRYVGTTDDEPWI